MVWFDTARTPDGMRIYTIGDVHGCLDMLREVHDWIARDLSRRPASDYRIIHLGDLIDRGPECPGTLDYMIEKSADPRFLSVRGNHDQYLVDFVTDPLTETFPGWASYGGHTTVEQYGAGPMPPPDAGRDARLALHDQLAPRVPAAHVDYLRGLPLTLSFGDYIFVHAGLRPGVPLADQSTQDLIWIREPFLSTGADFGAVVVHGHTPTDHIEVRRHRIGIDTGFVFGGTLSCIVLEGERKDQLVGRWLTPLELQA